MSYKLKNIILTPLQNKNTIKVTSDFGKRTYYNNITKKNVTSYHQGIDLIGSKVIVAVASGVVTSTRNTVKGYSEKYSSGNYITIKHADNISTSYLHLKQNSLKVKKGSIVSSGDIIAQMGSTGKSTGPHLHFAVKCKNKYVDPKPYLIGTKSLLDKTNNIEIIYIVKKGDNLTKIAKKYNTKWQTIYEKNKELIGENPNLIKVGWKLKI